MRTVERVSPLRRVLPAVLIPFLLLNCFVAPGLAQNEEPTQRLTVIVLQGQGEFVNVQNCCDPRQVAVEVRDESGRPVSNAQITFVLPDRGPSGTFPNNAKRVFVTTNSKGRAIATGLRHNGVLGQFPVQVMASYQGRSGRAAITQTNANFSRTIGDQPSTVLTENGPPPRKRGFPKKWLAVAGIAAGAGVALFLLTSESARDQRTVNITVGQPSVGGSRVAPGPGVTLKF